MMDNYPSASLILLILEVMCQVEQRFCSTEVLRIHSVVHFDQLINQSLVKGYQTFVALGTTTANARPITTGRLFTLGDCLENIISFCQSLVQSYREKFYSGTRKPCN